MLKTWFGKFLYRTMVVVTFWAMLICTSCTETRGRYPSEVNTSVIDYCNYLKELDETLKTDGLNSDKAVMIQKEISEILPQDTVRLTDADRRALIESWEIVVRTMSSQAKDCLSDRQHTAGVDAVMDVVKQKLAESQSLQDFKNQLSAL